MPSPIRSSGTVPGRRGCRLLFFYPDRGNIVITGEAGGWHEDGLGPAVVIRTGQPMILLEDLCMALRTIWPGQPSPPSVGCSIDPTAEGRATS